MERDDTSTHGGFTPASSRRPEKRKMDDEAFLSEYQLQSYYAEMYVEKMAEIEDEEDPLQREALHFISDEIAGSQSKEFFEEEAIIDDEFPFEEPSTLVHKDAPVRFFQENHVHHPDLVGLCVELVAKCMNANARAPNGKKFIMEVANSVPRKLFARIIQHASYSTLTQLLSLEEIWFRTAFKSPLFTLPPELIPTTTTTSKGQNRSMITPRTIVGSIKQEDDMWRFLYAKSKFHPYLLKHERSVLFNVHQPDIFPLFTLVEPENNPFQERINTVISVSADYGGDFLPGIVVDYATFLRNFNAFTYRQLAFINWDNVFIAGGSVLACLRPVPDNVSANEDDLYAYYRDKYPDSDIDIFLYGFSSEEEAKQKILDLHKQVLKANPEVHAVRTKYTITLFTGGTAPNIQIITSIYNTPLEVLVNFDLDCVAVGYNGRQVLAMPRFLKAIRFGVNHIDTSIFLTDRLHWNRMQKYAQRGFATVLPFFIRTHGDGGFDEQLPDPLLVDASSEDEDGITYCSSVMNENMKRLTQVLCLAKRGFFHHYFPNINAPTQYQAWQRVWQKGICYLSNGLRIRINHNERHPYAPNLQLDPNLSNEINLTLFIDTMTLTQKPSDRHDSEIDGYDSIKWLKDKFSHTTEELSNHLRIHYNIEVAPPAPARYKPKNRANEVTMEQLLSKLTIKVKNSGFIHDFCVGCQVCDNDSSSSSSSEDESEHQHQHQHHHYHCRRYKHHDKTVIDGSDNPFHAMNTTLYPLRYLHGAYEWKARNLQLIETKRISTPPFKIAGYSWMIHLEANAGRELYHIHLEKLPAKHDTYDDKKNVYANFVFTFKNKIDEAFNIYLDGSHIFSNAPHAKTWTSFVFGLRLDRTSKGPEYVASQYTPQYGYAYQSRPVVAFLYQQEENEEEAHHDDAEAEAGDQKVCNANAATTNARGPTDKVQCMDIKLDMQVLIVDTTHAWDD